MSALELPQDPGRVVDLPGYPFEESTCWIDFPESWRSRHAGRAPVEPQPVTHCVDFRPAEPVGEPEPDAKVLVLLDPRRTRRMVAAAPLGEVRWASPV